MCNLNRYTHSPYTNKSESSTPSPSPPYPSTNVSVGETQSYRNFSEVFWLGIEISHPIIASEPTFITPRTKIGLAGIVDWISTEHPTPNTKHVALLRRIKPDQWVFHPPPCIIDYHQNFCVSIVLWVASNDCVLHASSVLIWGPCHMTSHKSHY